MGENTQLSTARILMQFSALRRTIFRNKPEDMQKICTEYLAVGQEGHKYRKERNKRLLYFTEHYMCVF